MIKSCDYCGGRITNEAWAIAGTDRKWAHLNEDDEIDFRADNDHVARPDEVNDEEDTPEAN